MFNQLMQYDSIRYVFVAAIVVILLIIVGFSISYSNHKAIDREIYTIQTYKDLGVNIPVQCIKYSHPDKFEDCVIRSK